MIKEASKVFISKGQRKLEVSEPVPTDPNRCGVEQVIDAKHRMFVDVNRLLKALRAVGIEAENSMTQIKTGFNIVKVIQIVTVKSTDDKVIDKIVKDVNAQP